MKGRECSLCGGKLRGNICTECGLDNSKNDSNYRTTESHHKYENLTHTHEKADPFAGKTLTKEQRQQIMNRQTQSRSGPVSYTYSQSATTDRKQKPVRRKGKAGKIVVVFIILSVLWGALETVIDFYDVRDDSWETYESEAVYDYENYDPYENAIYDLEETGEHYDETLGAGCYIGGVHIPEGPYEVTVLEGYGMLRLDDSMNGIYEEYYYDDSNRDELVNTDFRIYKGAHVEIEGTLVIALWTEDAVLPLEGIENPNTEVYEETEYFTVGRDVEPGVYDITCSSGEGIFQYTVEYEDGYMVTFDTKEMGSEVSGEYVQTYKNIVLPEGTEVEITNMSVRLVPSEIIANEEYLEYYEESGY